jgi:hypothetical protein
MIINIDKSGTIDGFEKALQKTMNDPQTLSLLVMACDGNNITPEIANPLLQQIKIPVFGGIFPSILYEKEKLDKGTIVLGLPHSLEVAPILNLSDNQTDFIAQIDAINGNVSSAKTIFVFVDGFATRINAFISSIFTVFGLEKNYIGGGAGSLSMVSKPCLFSNKGLLKDSAVLAFYELNSGIGVSHGWESVSGPYRVTEAEHNIIKTLDWRPAFEVYHEAIADHSGLNIQKENFFDIAKAYPFGIAKLEAERIVRDPINVFDDNSIMCVGEIREGSFVDILNGNASSLISAAGNARALSAKMMPEQSTHGTTFFIDCISRVLFLEDKFIDELTQVWSQDFPLVGACTIGEIANSGNDFLEFYNKTSVVAMIES